MERLERNKIREKEKLENICREGERQTYIERKKELVRERARKRESKREKVSNRNRERKRERMVKQRHFEWNQRFEKGNKIFKRHLKK